MKGPLPVLVSLFSLIVMEGLFDTLGIPEVELLVLVTAALMRTPSQVGQLPKQLIWGDLGLWASVPSTAERCRPRGSDTDHSGSNNGSTR